MDLATAFALAVARRPEACAIIDGGEAHTYAQWHAESLRVAGGLGAAGPRARRPAIGPAQEPL